MRSADVALDVQGGVATIVIGADWSHSSLDSAARAQLVIALSAVANDPDVCAVVIHGGGSDFCDGHDLAEYGGRLALDSFRGTQEIDLQADQLVSSLAAVPKPVIAAVRGRCRGEGLALALACDLRVIADDAELSAATSAIGAHRGRGVRDALERCLGSDHARELVLSGRVFTAREGVDWGLVADVVPADRVVDMALGQAAMLARLPFAALSGAKMTLPGAAAGELERALGARTDRVRRAEQCAPILIH
ncbi:hypothetical protein ASD81_20165 [Nocardioides sp. Root614]|nr:hypothetical protein ASD81_20165 [Nocardioides sp. Root614]KRA86926.1 hypothetical protein ASD84_22380 [Nocardioides sp. Root682]